VFLDSLPGLSRPWRDEAGEGVSARLQWEELGAIFEPRLEVTAGTEDHVMT
jgi:hypothetical protein